MIAADTAVNDLNRRAQADRITGGQVSQHGVTVGAVTVGVGDTVITRHNDRRLTTGAGWVKNGDRWTVTTFTADGTLTVQRAGGHSTVNLPPAYVSQHLELGYATTAHRSQGRTVDTAHALINATTAAKSSAWPAPEDGIATTSTSTPATTPNPPPATANQLPKTLEGGSTPC